MLSNDTFQTLQSHLPYSKQEQRLCLNIFRWADWVRKQNRREGKSEWPVLQTGTVTDGHKSSRAEGLTSVLPPHQDHRWKKQNPTTLKAASVFSATPSSLPEWAKSYMNVTRRKQITPFTIRLSMPSSLGLRDKLRGGGTSMGSSLFLRHIPPVPAASLLQASPQSPSSLPICQELPLSWVCLMNHSPSSTPEEMSLVS